MLFERKFISDGLSSIFSSPHPKDLAGVIFDLEALKISLSDWNLFMNITFLRSLWRMTKNQKTFRICIRISLSSFIWFNNVPSCFVNRDEILRFISEIEFSHNYILLWNFICMKKYLLWCRNWSITWFVILLTLLWSLRPGDMLYELCFGLCFNLDSDPSIDNLEIFTIVDGLLLPWFWSTILYLSLETLTSHLHCVYVIAKIKNYVVGWEYI